MDDLRRRFASLERVQAPDLWSEIQSRSAASAGAALDVPVARISSPAAGAWRTPRSRSLMLLWAALVALLIAGTIAVGSGILHVPTIVVPPSTSPVDGTPAPATSAMPSPSVVSPDGLVAYTVREAIDPAPAGCTPPRSPRCGQERIWVVNADGSGARPLLPDVPGNQHFLAWHPDGTHILYTGDRGVLVLSDLSGSDAEVFPVTDICPVENCPYLDGIALSPAGSRIVYVLDDSPAGDSSVLAIFDLESRVLTLLEATRTTATLPCTTAAAQGVNDTPVWSPDETTIAFVRQGVGPLANDGGCQSRLHLINADGTNLRQLVPSEIRPLYAAWSSDGSAILFHDSVSSDPADTEATSNIHIVRADGSEPRRLTDDGHSAWPRLSRDGRIIFHRWTSPDGETFELWRMNLDGSGAVPLDGSIGGLSAAGCIVCRVASGPVVDADLFWQPAP